ncbi:MAG: deoxyribodipyrimidine photo-lyase [Thermomicrobiales bacterium]
MPDIRHLIPDNDPRLAVLQGGETRADAGRVLLWVQRAQRATGNLAANLAIEIANEIRLPVVAAFCLVPAFPRATLRAYYFMAEGLAELPAAFNQRGIGWALRTGEPETVIPALARELNAALVITDQNALRIGREWRDAVATELDVPFLAVDTDVVVPSTLFSNEEWAPRTIRPKIHRQLDQFLQPIAEPTANHPSRHRDGPDPLDAINQLGLDAAVGPAPDIHGGSSIARQRLQSFISERLPGYATDRNRADIDGTSRLSPYLHYGQIGPIEVALAIEAAGNDGAPSDDVAAFLDELIVHRELSINFALRNPGYDRFAGIPDWGQKTLAEHAADPRPHLYDLDRLAASETAEPVWNTAQRQMVAEGWMPNRLRMYWAKQIVRWSETPEEAFANTVALNDRSFLCGRDPIGYAQISWAVGGRHDRPFPPNKPIFGIVRPMTTSGLKRHFDVAAYTRQADERWGALDDGNRDEPAQRRLESDD